MNSIIIVCSLLFTITFGLKFYIYANNVMIKLLPNVNLSKFTYIAVYPDKNGEK